MIHDSASSQTTNPFYSSNDDGLSKKADNFSVPNTNKKESNRTILKIRKKKKNRKCMGSTFKNDIHYLEFE